MFAVSIADRSIPPPVALHELGAGAIQRLSGIKVEILRRPDRMLLIRLRKIFLSYSRIAAERHVRKACRSPGGPPNEIWCVGTNVGTASQEPKTVAKTGQ
jgi:hypothetical protein